MQGWKSPKKLNKWFDKFITSIDFKRSKYDPYA